MTLGPAPGPSPPWLAWADKPGPAPYFNLIISNSTSRGMLRAKEDAWEPMRDTMISLTEYIDAEHARASGAGGGECQICENRVYGWGDVHTCKLCAMKFHDACQACAGEQLMDLWNIEEMGEDGADGQALFRLALQRLISECSEPGHKYVNRRREDLCTCNNI